MAFIIEFNSISKNISNNGTNENGFLMSSLLFNVFICRIFMKILSKVVQCHFKPNEWKTKAAQYRLKIAKRFNSGNLQRREIDTHQIDHS